MKPVVVETDAETTIHHRLHMHSSGAHKVKRVMNRQLKSTNVGTGLERLNSF
jgi:hypothetical protein